MKNSSTKSRGLKITAFLLFAIMIVFMLASCSGNKTSSTVLSPGINSIAEQNQMAKSAMKGEEISFSAKDFARSANLASINTLTITELPPISDGELRIGSSVLTTAQTLSAASVDLMTYTASSDISSSEFRFRIDDSPYEMCCKLYMLTEKNYAPTLSMAPKTALEVSTYKNVTMYGTLPCYDPDGDPTYIEIVSYPEKGVLDVSDPAVGTYRYIPYENSTGKDSFTYVARDMYGNYSASQKVSLTIDRKETNVSYVDLADSPYHNAAIAMTEKGIMSGTQVGSNTYFYPANTVSRAEFVVMAMNAAGITDVNPATATIFADDADIPSHMKGYISAAYELGYIKGSPVDGKLCFNPQDAITRAEAAVMLSNMLDAATPTITPVFGDSEDIPVWAQASVSSMNYMGVLNINEGNKISPLSKVTRGDAAEILVNFMSVKNN